MDGLAHATGTGPHITLCGEHLKVTGRILRYYAEIEAEIVRRRHPTPLELIDDARERFGDHPDAFKIVCESALLELKSWHVVTRKELWDWVQNTQSGWLFFLWLALRDNDPKKYTLAEITDMWFRQWEEIVSKAGENAAEEFKQEVERAVDQASGDGLSGN